MRYFRSNNDKMNDFTTKNFKFNSPGTVINGDVRYQNLFTSQRPFYMKGDFDRLSSNYYQLRTLLPNILGRTLPSSFQKFGQFNIRGITEITEESIDANLIIDTEIGGSVSDLKLTQIDDIDNASYVGNLSLIHI